MAKYDNWKFVKGKAVSSLNLDDLNPRMPPGSAGRSQSELIIDLIEKDDAYSLAKQISTHGFFPNSDVIVMPKPGAQNKWVVLEGNRRVCALKALRRPELAPQSEQKRWRMLGANAEEISKINVWVVPDRESAEVYLAMKHAPPDKGLMEQWTPMQQAAFYGRFLGDLSVTEISQRFSTSESNVAARLRLYRLYLLGRRISLDGQAKLYWEPRNFPSSIIERIFDSPDARSILRVKFDKEGDIEIESSESDFLSAYKAILENIGPGDEKLNTRSLDTATDITERISSVVGGRIKKASGGSHTASEIVRRRSAIEDSGDSESPPQPKKPEQKKKKQAPKRFGNGLFPEKLVASLSDARLPSILKELQTIDEKHHNATGVLLRIALELAMIGWLKANKEWGTVSAKAKNPYGPNLSSMFKHIESLPKGFTNPLDSQEKTALTSLLHRGGLDDLNGWVHNPNYPSDSGAVRSLCTRLKPLLERLLSGI